MRRTFKLVHPKIKIPRLVEGAVYETRKYLKRERKRDLPDGADFWDFDCRCGPTEDEARSTHVNDLSKRIAQAADQNLEAIFIEIIARPAKRRKA